MSRKMLFWLTFPSTLPLLVGGSLLLLAESPAAAPPAKQRPASPQEKVPQALGRRLELNYDRVPLDRVARDLQNKLGVPVRLDDRSLTDGGR